MTTLSGKEKKELFWKTSMVPLLHVSGLLHRESMQSLDSLNCVFRDERNSNTPN